jgi:DNA-directed RNA polymerase subunit beta'
VLDVNFFDELRIGLATAEDIRQWSHGEVKKPETINYRTLKPEKDGLFCEKIFGPTRDWECYCGKYKRVRLQGHHLRAVRRGGHPRQGAPRAHGPHRAGRPVTHIWYFKGVPSRLGYLLDLAPKDLEKVIYFAAYMITSVDEERVTATCPRSRTRSAVERERSRSARHRPRGPRQKLEEDLATLEAEGAKADASRKVKDGAEREMKQLRDRAPARDRPPRRGLDTFKSSRSRTCSATSSLYREMTTGSASTSRAHGRHRQPEAAGDLRRRPPRSKSLRARRSPSSKGQRKERAAKRLKVVERVPLDRNSPLGMVLDCVR